MIDMGKLVQAIRVALLEGDVAGAQAMLDQLGPASASDLNARYMEAAVRWASGDAAGAEAALASARHGHALLIIDAAGGDLARLAADPAYALEVGRQFYRAKQMAPAAVAFAYASSVPGGHMLTALQLCAEALHYEGRTEDAAEAFAAAFRLDPNPHRHSFVLYASFFLEDGVVRHAAEARRWGQLWADTIRPMPLSAEAEPLGGRPLRVGYLAPSFTTNQTHMFVQPLLEAHDPAAVELFLYVEDAAKERVAPHIRVRSTGGNTP
jgi:tetratricopeptide (TPR) repeat protein